MSESDRYHHGDLRAALIDAGQQLIAERGLDAFSLRACARAAGVSHAAPYRHFADKQALIDAVAAEGFARLAEAGRAAAAGEAGARARLDAYGVAYVLFARRHPGLYRAMFSPTAGCAQEAAVLQQAGDAAFGLLVELVEQALQPADAMLEALRQWALVHGLAELMNAGRLPREQVEDEEALASLVLRVLRQGAAGS